MYRTGVLQGTMALLFFIEGKEEEVRIQRDFFKAGGLCTWINNMHDQDGRNMGENDTIYCLPELAGCER